MSETPLPGIIEVKGLQSGYHGVTVLKGLDFKVGNEVFAVLGANGAGKTTLLATLARLIPIMGGAIRFESRDISALPPYDVAAAGVGLAMADRRDQALPDEEADATPAVAVR